jgi:4-amino-4-deoxy-L-arabinose transferase-like glycosyltransferase
MKTITPLRIALFFVAVKLLIQLLTAQNLGFHRDEFLYLSLGRHLDWGFWSNPPFIGGLGWLAGEVFGGSLLATRVLPAIGGAALVWVTAQMVRELGGRAFAQLLCGTAMLFSIAWLRAFSMLQPVPFDVLFWTLLSYVLLLLLKTGQSKWWWWLGLIAGVGFLNKYSILFWVACLPVALLCTPKRNILARKEPWLALGLALLIAAPNLYWQWQHGFPVVHHMQQLSENQLSHVKPLNFLVDQLFMSGAGTLLWLPGVFYLLVARSMQPYRTLGWLYVAVLGLLFVLHGKSYYTLGVYPVLFAAGSVYWENRLQRVWSRSGLLLVILALSVPLVPVGIPVMPAEKLVPYFQWLSKDVGLEAAVRWERGNLEALPQDYADMLGWDELAGFTRQAILEAGAPGTWFVYAENYGEAGAAEQLTPYKRPGVVSFSDSWLLWTPDTLPPGIQAMIYINDQPGADMKELFGDIRKIGAIQNPLAREQGTGVYLCRQPRQDLQKFWKNRISQIKSSR